MVRVPMCVVLDRVVRSGEVVCPPQLMSLHHPSGAAALCRLLRGGCSGDCIGIGVGRQAALVLVEGALPCSVLSKGPQHRFQLHQYCLMGARARPEWANAVLMVDCGCSGLALRGLGSVHLLWWDAGMTGWW